MLVGQGDGEMVGVRLGGASVAVAVAVAVAVGGRVGVGLSALKSSRQAKAAIRMKSILRVRRITVL
jgi:hypothetical protein